MLTNAPEPSQDSSPSFSPHNDPIESPLKSPVDTNHAPIMPHLPPIVSGTPGDKEVAAAASKGRKKKYIGWWQEIEQMFDKGLLLNLRYDPYTKKPCEEDL